MCQTALSDISMYDQGARAKGYVFVRIEGQSVGKELIARLKLSVNSKDVLIKFFEAVGKFFYVKNYSKNS